MKIAIIQFIKKIKFAVGLSRAGLTNLLAGLKAFALVYPLAALFRRPSAATPAQRFSAYLDRHRTDLFFRIFAEEIVSSPYAGQAANYVFPAKKSVVLENSPALDYSVFAPNPFYASLLNELLEKDFPQGCEVAQSILRRFDLAADLRLYASEVEELAALVSATPFGCSYAVNWLRTNEHNLWLESPRRLELTSGLSPAAQQNLVALFIFLFYERNLFVSAFDRVLVDEQGHVGWLEFDYLHSVDSSGRSFLKSFLNGNAHISSLQEAKLYRSLTMLEKLCPATAVRSLLAEQAEQFPVETPLQFPENGNLWEAFKRYGFYAPPSPAEGSIALLSRIYDRGSFAADSRLKKSSWRYWLPLLITILLLSRCV